MSERLPGLNRVADELRDWLESLRLALGGDSVSLWTRSSEGDTLVTRLTMPAGAKVEPDEVPVEGHALGWVLTEGVALRASRREIFRRTGGQGWVVAAPVSEPAGERIGCVAMEFSAVPRLESPRALELAATLAGRLLGDVRAAQRAMDDLRKYKALHGAIHELDRELDLEELATGVCQRACSVAGARAAVAAAWDAQRAEGKIIAAVGLEDRGLKKARFDGESSFLGLALRNATILPRDDLRGKTKFPLYAEAVNSRAASAIIAPLMVDDTPIGALAVEYERPRQFSDGDIDRLQTLAVFVAPAFRNALKYGEVRALSLTDALTGLPNRRSTERILASTIALAARTRTPFAVAIADVDHFKRFNDRYGHEAGDLVLRTVARVIRDALRPGDHAGRWGGEEFLIVLPSTSLEDAVRVIERIRRSVEAVSFAWQDQRLTITLSAGVSAYPDLVRDGTAAVTSADNALYKAKRAGRNAVALADEGR